MLRTTLALLIFGGATLLRADQIQMQNGDRFSGNVVSITPNAVVLQSDVLGRVTLERGKVANISLGAGAIQSVAAPAASVPAPTPAVPSPQKAAGGQATIDIGAALRGLGANTNAIEQIHKQFLDGAGPEATQKFNDLLGGLTSGQIDINGLRQQAKDAADKLRKMKKDVGGEAGDMLDAYLNILDSFLAQSANTVTVTTNAQGATATR